MHFRPAPLDGALLLEMEQHHDVRGFFGRIWCAKEFAGQGLPATLAQISMSRNLRRGTLRGMHLQLPPSREAKLVSCMRGSIYDVVIDMRPQSPTFLQHFGIELDAQKHEALFVPPWFAHGFQALADDSDVLYLMTDFHAPELSLGVRWNDAAFGIRWPIVEPSVVLPRDAAYPDLDVDAYRRDWEEA